VARRPTLALLPKFFSLAVDAKIGSKAQSNIAVALSSILMSMEVTKDYKRIIDIAKGYLGTTDVHLIMAATAIAEIMKSCGNSAAMLDIYQTIAGLAIGSHNREVFNGMLEALRKILKVNAIPETETAPLLSAILSGAHPIFERKPPALFTDKDTQIYGFLKSVALRYEHRAAEICNVVLRWLRDAPLSMLPVFLELVEFLVNKKVVQGDAAKELASFLVARISGQKDNLDEILVGIIVMLLKNDPTVLDKDTFVSRLLLYWQETREDELSGWRAQVASGILDLCALGAEMDEDVVVEILGDYPGEPVFGKCNDMSRALIALTEDQSGKWTQILPAAAQSLTAVLVLTKDEIQQLQLEPETVTAMKLALKRLLKARPDIAKEIRKHLGKDRATLTRFDAVLK
jgi:hypothetical protein